MSYGEIVFRVSPAVVLLAAMVSVFSSAMILVVNVFLFWMFYGGSDTMTKQLYDNTIVWGKMAVRQKPLAAAFVPLA